MYKNWRESLCFFDKARCAATVYTRGSRYIKSLTGVCNKKPFGSHCAIKRWLKLLIWSFVLSIHPPVTSLTGESSPTANTDARRAKRWLAAERFIPHLFIGTSLQTNNLHMILLNYDSSVFWENMKLSRSGIWLHNHLFSLSTFLYTLSIVETVVVSPTTHSTEWDISISNCQSAAFPLVIHLYSYQECFFMSTSVLAYLQL